jgi:hypothetical protein
VQNMLKRPQISFPSLFFCFFVFSFTQVMANKCSKADQNLADLYQNYYAPPEAHAFGSKIQKLIMDKDLPGIFSLVRGELKNGPRKKFIAQKTFKEIFDDEWVKQVLAGEAPCSPAGSRGFMLGNGLVHYDKLDGQWTIFSINGAQQETLDNQLPGWTINEQVVHPFCFNRPWLSGDNFQEFAKVFKIKKVGQFFNDPGLFMGGEISNFSPIKPSWCSNDNECKQISLVSQLDQCTQKGFDFKNQDGQVLVEDSSNGYKIEYSYKVLAPVGNNTCSKLAPNIGAKCRKAYLISVGDYSGGSMGWDISYGIYGLFDLPNFGPSIVPLKFFQNKNEALNFLDLTK